MKWIGAAVVAGLLSVGVSPSVGAWAFENEALELRSSTVVAGVPPIDCPQGYRTTMVEGVSRLGCPYDGTERSGFVFDGGIAVRGRSDASYRVVRGVCEAVKRCFYSPSTQKVIEVRRDVSLRIVASDGSERLFAERVIELALSSNGMYTALEIESKGIAIIALKTHRITYIASDITKGSIGNDLDSDLAVTDDGLTVAHRSTIGSLRIYHVASCGVDVSTTVDRDLSNPCTLYYPDTSGLPSGSMAGALRLAFVNESNFSFYRNDPKGVMLYTASPVSALPTRLTYVAMGDSFQSGEGDTDDWWYKEGTNTERERCHVSRRSYPYLFAASRSLKSFASVACSGAVIDDVIALLPGYKGQGSRSSFLTSTDQHAALASFLPGRLPQRTFVERYRPSIITLGIGGNDAGFFAKLKTCAGLDTCEWAQSNHRAATKHEIDAVKPRLVETYEAIKQSSPLSVLVVVGYPQVIAMDSCGTINAFLNNEERKYVRESISYLNATIYGATQEAGVSYVSMDDIFQGYELCSKSPLAVNGLRFGEELVGIVGSESFHPTFFGHTLMANRLGRQFNGYTFSECSCAIHVNQSYWGDESLVSPAQKYANDMIDGYNILTKVVKLHLAAGSFAPNTPVRLELHSDPVVLGDFISAADGGIEIEAALPDVEPGYHTLQLRGVNDKGEAVMYYKEIFISASDEYEEGGVVDESDDQPQLEQNQPPVSLRRAWLWFIVTPLIGLVVLFVFYLKRRH